MDILKQYIPEKALNFVFQLIKNNNIYFKITPNRNTKQGDFTSPNKITINCSLNKYSFLITTIHEIAHFFVYKKYRGSIKPHGIEWKNKFINLMNEMPLDEIFPNDILEPLENYLINPKASTSSDEKLFVALKKYDFNDNNNTILEELKDGENFIFRNNQYKKINKRTKLIICKNLNNGKDYLFKPFTEVEVK